MYKILFKLLITPFDYTVILLIQLLNEYPSYISIPIILLSVLFAWKIIIFVLEKVTKKITNKQE